MGQLDGVEKGYGAGFQMCEWVPPSLADRMEDIQQMMMKPTNPTDGTDMTLSDNNVLAMWMNEFTRDDTRPDSFTFTALPRAFTCKSSFVRGLLPLPTLEENVLPLLDSDILRPGSNVLPILALDLRPIEIVL